MEQPKGNFRININRNKKPGDNQPVLERGIISTPDAPDETFEVKLWAYKDKNGALFYSGPTSPVATTARAIERTEAMIEPEQRDINADKIDARDAEEGRLTLEAHRIMLFKNGFKIAKDDPGYGKLSADEKAVNDRRPELYGFWNPGVSKDGEIREMLKVSVWEQQGRYGPFLAGNTQVPQLKEQAEPATPPSQRATEIKGGRKPKPERDSR